MKTKLIVICILLSLFILLIIIPTAPQAKKLEVWETKTWNPGMMTWTRVSRGQSGTKFMYSEAQYKVHKNKNICLWVGLENKKAFKAIYTCIDPGRKKFHHKKEVVYDKDTKITSYMYDVMTPFPKDYMVTDLGIEWDDIEDGTLMDNLWNKLTGNEPLFQIRSRIEINE